MIVDIQKSNRPYKRYMITMDDGRGEFHFGLKTGRAFIDHGNELLRENYWARHYANPTEKRLIDNLIPSSSLFSALLLWGPYSDIESNIEHLNRLWKNKYQS